MLGIDICENSIRIVNLKRRGSNFILQTPVRVPLDEQERNSPISLGHKLREALKKHGWLRQKAVMNLPGRMCFVRRLPVELLHKSGVQAGSQLHRGDIDELLNIARSSMLVSADDLILDIWSKPANTGERLSSSPEEEVILLAAARKTAEQFCRTVAEEAGIKLQSLELRSLAAVNGLFFHWQTAEEANIAVVYLEDKHGDIAFYDADGLISLQTINQPALRDKGKSAQESLVEQITRVVNTLKLAEPTSLPGRIFLGGNNFQTEHLDELADRIKEKLAIPVTVCPSHIGMTLPQQAEDIPNLADFQPALGAALDGMDISPTWFNFLHPRGRLANGEKSVTWRPFVLAAAMVIAAACIVWFYQVELKISHRDQLRQSLIGLQPQLDRINEAKKNWTLFKEYLPPSRNGSRLSYLNILYEINQLMPDTKDAYITKLVITNTTPTSSDSNYDISITGRTTQGDKLTEFINSLNGSMLFQGAKQEGSRAVETSSDPLYPVSFQVICNLRRDTTTPSTPKP